jgi:hypothetical protein
MTQPCSSTHPLLHQQGMQHPCRCTLAHYTDSMFISAPHCMCQSHCLLDHASMSPWPSYAPLCPPPSQPPTHPVCCLCPLPLPLPQTTQRPHPPPHPPSPTPPPLQVLFAVFLGRGLTQELVGRGLALPHPAVDGPTPPADFAARCAGCLSVPVPIHIQMRCVPPPPPSPLPPPPCPLPARPQPLTSKPVVDCTHKGGPCPITAAAGGAAGP